MLWDVGARGKKSGASVLIHACMKKDLMRQDWAVCWAPTDQQNGPTNGFAVNTPLPIKVPTLRSVCDTWIKANRDVVKSTHPGNLKVGKLGVGGKANKCSHAG